MTTASPDDNHDQHKDKDNATEKTTLNLARLREQAGLSLDDMSNQLKLNRDLLRRLERGETEFLGAPAYIRGYLKNYAKVLGVSAEELMRDYPIPADELPRISTQYAIANVVSRRRSSGHFLGYLLGTLVVAAFAYGIWYMMSQTQASDVNSVKVIPGALAEKDASDSKTTADDFHYSSLLPPAPPANTADGQKEGGQAPAKGSLLDDSLPEAQKSGTMEKDSHKTGEASPPSTSATSAKGPSGNPTVTGQAPPVPTGGTDTDMAELVIVLNEPAWVSVRQTDGARIEHNLLPAGTYRYQAALPVHFRLGNAGRVQVKINGVPVALDRWTHKNVADFDWPTDPSALATN